MKKNLKKKVPLLFLLFAFLNTLFIYSQDSETSIRTSFNLEKKITKKISVELTPEIRLDQNFDFESFIVKADFDYKFRKWLSAGVQYRLKGSKEDDTDTESDSSTAYSNRFAISASTKFKLDRFTPKFRLQFSNFSDFDDETEDKTNYLRYRFGADYNIKKSKITPYASIESFQKMSNGLISKTRYSLGAEYEFNKSSSFDLGYSLDHKYKKQTNNNIVAFNYKYKF